MVKITISNSADIEELLDAEAYQALIGA
jgi:hypothetical protein